MAKKEEKKVKKPAKVKEKAPKKVEKKEPVKEKEKAPAKVEKKPEPKRETNVIKAPEVAKKVKEKKRKLSTMSMYGFHLQMLLLSVMPLLTAFPR